MTKIMCLASGKGGVGKTMLTANLGAALAERGKDVVIMDANLTTPNLGLHLGIPLFPVTLHDVLKGTAQIQDAIYEHERGLKIVPAGISLRDLRGVDVKNIQNAVLDMLGKADIVLMDCAAGLGREALSAMEASDEILIVTNPDISSLTDALKAAKLAEELGSRVAGAVINRVSGKAHELKITEIEKMLGDIEILAEIPEHEKVKRAISRRSPVVYRYPDSLPSQHIKALAAKLVGEEYRISIPWYKRLFGIG